MKYIERDGYLERVWHVEYKKNFFQWVLLIRGTEPEARAYMESEFGYMGAYYALGDSEIEAAKKLRMKIYIAPKLNNEQRWR